MDQPGHGAIALFGQRIVGLAQTPLEFGGGRDDGASERLVLVVAGDKAHIVRCNAHRQHGLTLREGRPLVVRKHQHLLDLGEGPQAISGLPTPIVPVPIGDLGVERLAERPGLEGAAWVPARGSTGGKDVSVRRWSQSLRPRESRTARWAKSWNVVLGGSSSSTREYEHASASMLAIENHPPGIRKELGARHPYPLLTGCFGQAYSVIHPRQPPLI